MATKKSEKAAVAPATAVFKVTTDGTMINLMNAECLAADLNLRENIHITLCSIVCHAIVHNQVTPGTDLVLGLHRNGNVRADSINKWLQTFGPFKWKKVAGKDGKASGKYKFDADFDASDYHADPEKYVKKLLAKPYWEFDPPKELKGLDFLKQLDSLIARGEAIEEDDELLAKSNLAGLEQARQFRRSLKAGPKVIEGPTVH